MSYRSGFGGPKPVEMGKEYEVEISEVSRRGDGIARIQGFVIFVEGAKTGQKTKTHPNLPLDKSKPDMEKARIGPPARPVP